MPTSSLSQVGAPVSKPAPVAATDYIWGDPQPDRAPRPWPKSALLVAVAMVIAAGATYLVTGAASSGTSGTGPGGGFPGGSQGGGSGSAPNGQAQDG